MRHFFDRFQDAVRKNWDGDALCNYGGESFKYSEIAVLIEKFHIFFEKCNFHKGDKIALCAKNSARWGISFLAASSCELVVVPILSDFHPDSVNKLVSHSESVALFTDPEIWRKLDIGKMPGVRVVVSNADFTLLYSGDEEIAAAYSALEETFKARYPMGFARENVKYPQPGLDELALINYTSGTTSAPKGVMLTYGNISSTVDFGQRYMPSDENDRIVSMLPMAHMYGLIYEFLYPLSNGTPIYFLGKTPSPTLLMKAMKDVKPYLVVSVPLVMEKIYKSSIKPVLQKPSVSFAVKIPLVNRFIYKKVHDSIMAAFGGKMRMLILGGAALNPEVEKCFHNIRIPFTCGYGMTEAAPLLTYEEPARFVPGTCGKAIDCCELKIDSEDPEHIPGEILCKGDNICKGYYKNPEATANAFTPDGYMRTGDLGVIDSRGYLHIRGRSKSMILTANGQNVYPEELESLVNNCDFVVESVVVDRSSKIVALVYLDRDAIRRAGLDEEAVSDIPENVRVTVNRQLPAYSQITKVEVVDAPFEKTPKMSIKRFLYK